MTQLIIFSSTQLNASSLELRHLQEDHDRLMERHSALLQEMAQKELAARQRHEQLAEAAAAAERARQDAMAKGGQEAEQIKQSYRVRIFLKYLA